MLHPDAVPRCPGRAPLAWMAPVFRVHDDAMLPEVGLDAVFFVKFTRLVRPRCALPLATAADVSARVVRGCTWCR
jgi:hypothetical protein